MLVKVLGVFDITAGILLFALGFGIEIPVFLLIIFGVYLLIKSPFIFTYDLASFFDLFAGILFIIATFVHPWSVLCFIGGFLVFQKGIFSLI